MRPVAPKVVGDRVAANGDGEQGAEGRVACSTSIEAEDELVEVALQVLGAQPVINAARQALRFRELLLDPWPHDVGGHGADAGIVMYGRPRCCKGKTDLKRR